MKLYRIPLVTEGRLSIAACPSAATLDEDVATLVDQGVTIVLSALTDKDELALGLATEPLTMEAAGIDFVRVPIVDFGVPEDNDAVDRTLRDLLDRLGDPNEHLAIHCFAGRGRSPMLAAALLVAAGEAPDLAWQMISTARRRPVPETPEQRDWIDRFISV